MKYRNRGNSKRSCCHNRQTKQTIGAALVGAFSKTHESTHGRVPKPASVRTTSWASVWTRSAPGARTVDPHPWYQWLWPIIVMIMIIITIIIVIVINGKNDAGPAPAFLSHDFQESSQMWSWILTSTLKLRSAIVFASSLGCLLQRWHKNPQPCLRALLVVYFNVEQRFAMTCASASISQSWLFVVRPISILRFWMSEGLTQA